MTAEWFELKGVLDGLDDGGATNSQAAPSS